MRKDGRQEKAWTSVRLHLRRDHFIPAVLAFSRKSHWPEPDDRLPYHLGKKIHGLAGEWV
jgi:hypothetical protein